MEGEDIALRLTYLDRAFCRSDRIKPFKLDLRPDISVSRGKVRFVDAADLLQGVDRLPPQERCKLCAFLVACENGLPARELILLMLQYYPTPGRASI